MSTRPLSVESATGRGKGRAGRLAERGRGNTADEVFKDHSLPCQVDGNYSNRILPDAARSNEFRRWFKKGSGTFAPAARRVLRTKVPDPFLNHALFSAIESIVDKRLPQP